MANKPGKKLPAGDYDYDGGRHKWTCNNCGMWSIDYSTSDNLKGISRKAKAHRCGGREDHSRKDIWD